MLPHKILRNDHKLFKCRLHAVDADYVHITLLLHDLKADSEKAGRRRQNIILKTGFCCTETSTGAKNVMTGGLLLVHASGSVGNGISLYKPKRRKDNSRNYKQKKYIQITEEIHKR